MSSATHKLYIVGYLRGQGTLPSHFFGPEIPRAVGSVGQKPKSCFERNDQYYNSMLFRWCSQTIVLYISTAVRYWYMYALSWCPRAGALSGQLAVGPYTIQYGRADRDSLGVLYGKLTENCSAPLCPPRAAAFPRAFVLKSALFPLRGVANSEPACAHTAEVLVPILLTGAKKRTFPHRSGCAHTTEWERL
eukprot:COSAG02_NODE_486_length_21363_cov_22.137509_5_plen_191_part_00